MLFNIFINKLSFAYIAGIELSVKPTIVKSFMPSIVTTLFSNSSSLFIPIAENIEKSLLFILSITFLSTTISYSSFGILPFIKEFSLILFILVSEPESSNEYVDS